MKNNLLAFTLFLSLTGMGLAAERERSGNNGYNNLEGKLFVTNTKGEVTKYDTITSEVLTERHVYRPKGTAIITQAKSEGTFVQSNGVGLFVDEDTNLLINVAEHDQFQANITDLDTENGISRTRSYLKYGVVGICTGLLNQSSEFTYSTPTAGMRIQGRRAVIEVSNDSTKIYLLEGSMSVSNKDKDRYQVLKDGQMAIIPRVLPGAVADIAVQAIPKEKRAWVEDRAVTACLARKTVYFNVLSTRGPTQRFLQTANSASDAAGADAAAAATQPQITASSLIPAQLPTEFTVSPAVIYRK